MSIDDAPTEVETDQTFSPIPVDATFSGPHFALVELNLNPHEPVEINGKRQGEPTVSAGLSINDTTWDGERFPWYTVGAMKIDLGRRDVATITLTIPVKLVAKPPKL